MRSTRRQFLKNLVVSAGAVSVGSLIGCGGGSSDNNDGIFIPPDDSDSSDLQEGTRFFPQSVASGDPKPDSVVLWTRVQDDERSDEALLLTLQVAEDDAFENVVSAVDLAAEPQFDHCARVKIINLTPGRHYFYRFIYGRDGAFFVSRTGRSKTAPAADSDTPVRFAFANCQDYIGRFYNTYLPLLEAEYDNLDFIVHLGDYIYETTGDPSFQNVSTERGIRFNDAAGAIALGEGDGAFFAAASLDNYRQLYRVYRADPILQQIHERFPVIAIWDDHEYSNDNWQDHATYFNGRQNEQNTARKRQAEQAWFEYMPIDDAVIDTDDTDNATILTVDPAQLFPNTQIYRDFRFGRYLHLAVLDSRTLRPDHIIPEDAFPGWIVLDEPTLRAALGASFDAVAASFAPYQDFATLTATEQGTLTAIVTQLYQAEGLSAEAAAQQTALVLQGNIDINYANALLTAAMAEPIDPTGRPRGISYLLLGKQDVFSFIGARNLVAQATFDLLAQILAPVLDEDLLGPLQRLWLQDSLLTSDATWKIVGSSISFTSMVLDLAQDPASLPIPEEARQALSVIQTTPELQPLANKFYLSVDQWDGFPNARKALLDLIRQNVGAAVLIAGDIHASFVTDHSTSTGRLFELTGPAVSSNSFQGEVISQVEEIGLDTIPGIDALVQSLADLLTPAIDSPLVTQQIEYANTGDNGIVVVELDGTALTGTYHLLTGEQALLSFYDDPQAALDAIERRVFQINAGSGGVTAL